ncbi:MAG: type III pantothenate kinase [Cyanobacteria bacterium J06648_11]
MNLSKRDFENDTRAPWLAIAIGNSRILWGQWLDTKLVRWGRVEIAPNAEFERQVRQVGDRTWLASVSCQEKALDLWPALRRSRQLSLVDVPLAGGYDTFGLDRALALVGAASQVGWPVLVVDGGTALTFTGADPTGWLVGGAIVPGLALQARALHSSTAALPEVNLAPDTSLERWAKTTELAIESGVMLGAIATVRSFCDDWRTRYPDSAIAFTGGDGEYLHRLAAIPHSIYNPALVLHGIAACRSLLLSSNSPPIARQSGD